MRRAYKFRMRPTARQHVALAACVESHRELYNAALAERRYAWTRSNAQIRYGDQSSQLSEIRRRAQMWRCGRSRASKQRCAGSTRPSAGFSGASKLGNRLDIRGLRAAPGLTVWSGRRMVTALDGIQTSAGCICKALDTSRSRCIEVDPRHTSDRCEACGHAAPENRVTQADFVCQACTHSAQADEQAARNILRAGLALHAAQAA